jgi:DNA repair and recombination protein RAD52
MFTAEQKSQLAAPLNRNHVRSRTQGGRGVSYIEGWRAIDEANRIFGHDGWTRETTEIKCVSERERKIGKEPNTRDGWGVSYIAKVKVVAFAGDTIVTREGVGAGHGIDVDCGQAHESAIKEAETDAMKRALMTFGNPFGLALYDKEQTNVADLDSPKARYLAQANAVLDEATSAQVLGEWWNSDGQKEARRFVDLSATELSVLKSAVTARIETLKKATAA